MLKILEGGFYSSAYESLKEEIRTLVNEKKRVLLIVPEQQAVVAESDILPTLPRWSPLYFEVTNFTRLADTVYRRVGGLSGEYADKSREALIMWRTLTELAPVLDMVGRDGEVSQGAVLKAMAAVAEMKSISADAEMLAELEDSDALADNTRLRSKLSDISKILSLYNSLLVEKYSSTRDECDRLAEKLKKNPGFFKDTHIFLTGFTSFTEPQYKVLSELVKDASVTVHLVGSRLLYDFFEFTEIKNTRESLLRIADLGGVRKEIARSESQGADRINTLRAVSELIFRSFGELDEEYRKDAADAVRIFEARDPYEASRFVAADIKRRVMEGEKLSDFAIIARDTARYIGIIDAALSEADIPAFISKRRPVVTYEPIKLIFAAAEAVRGGFRREDVISYAKCRLLSVSADACDEFELYTEKWQINKSRFTDGVFWNMSPDGYSVRHSADEGERLIRINETREKIIAPLVTLKDDMTAAKTVKEKAAALVKFLTGIDLEKKIEERRLTLLSLGEADADDYGSLWGIICTALDTLVEVLGDSEVDARSFMMLLQTVFSAMDVGKIPAYYDEVTIGAADMIRLTGKKHVYLIGVNQGEFPTPARESSYFTDKDREALSALGLKTDAKCDIAYARELFFFLRAFATAKESVTLLYSTRNEALAKVERADVIDRILEMCGKLRPVAIRDIPAEEKIYFPAMAMEFMDDAGVEAALRAAGLGDKIEVSRRPISNLTATLGQDVVNDMYPDGISLTQTRIDSYVGCPFAHFLRFNLKLSEDDEAKFDARNVGSFIHAILESFFGELRENKKSAGQLGEAEREQMIKRAAKKYLGELLETGASKRTEILIDRLSHAAKPVVDSLCDELEGSSFVPEFFELKIGRGSEALPSPARFETESGRDVNVYGSIDRVDTYKHGEDVYVRVIDYKTGNKTFSPSDLDEGRNLQMFLYLKAVVESDNPAFKKRLGVGNGGKIIPAGVIYVKTDMSDVTIPHADPEEQEKAIRKKQERRGMLLADDVSLEAMNKEYLPVKFKKDGTPDARSQKLLYDSTGWQTLSDKVERKVCEVADGMCAGNIGVGGKDAPCEYCAFKSICRK
ncbi:MAG: PD-(D/E)XK nuclease family protein [Clostridia bacterium]|nr:PD-(D/E)XK nuclease family protein [Clostridia bacterium]